MPFVLAQIRLGVKVLKPWYGFVIRDVATLTDVFAELSARKLDSEPPLAEELRSSPATCSAGRSKSDLVKVSPTSPVGEVVSCLGQYLDFCCSQEEEDTSAATGNEAKSCAFAMLMNSASSSCHLPKQWDGANKKAEMKNAVLKFLLENKLGWDQSSVESCGINFVGTLVDCLWYVDGNQETLAARSCPVPPMFQQFAGFNCPELRKKRKRDQSNLKASELGLLLISQHKDTKMLHDIKYKPFTILFELSVF